MDTMNLNDLIEWLKSLPEDVKDKEIWYIDISYPIRIKDSIFYHVDENRLTMSN